MGLSAKDVEKSTLFNFTFPSITFNLLPEGVTINCLHHSLEQQTMQKRKCEEGEMYFNNGCHKDDSDICGETQVLILNHFGEGKDLLTWIWKRLITFLLKQNSNFSYLGECHTLLEQGPCQRNHWLVANDFENKHFADCKRRICQEGEIHFNDTCHKNDSNAVCGESQILLLNLFGEGMSTKISKNQI